MTGLQHRIRARPIKWLERQDNLLQALGSLMEICSMGGYRVQASYYGCTGLVSLLYQHFERAFII